MMKFTVLLLAGLAAAATPHSASTSPRPEVGSLSYSSDASDHHCTASIVASPKGNIIITAAHCVAGKSAVFFTPGYNDGKAPHGTWRSASIHIDAGWSGSNDIDHAGSPYDYAFVVLQPQNGKNVAEVTGASLNLKTDATLPTKMQVLGYPSTSYVKSGKYKDTLYQCGSTASKNGASWESLECVGIPGGFSGGPWIVENSKDLFGVIGGKGQSLPDTDPDNYSVRFDSRVRDLYNKAVAATVPAGNGNLGYQLGDGPLWTHADLIVSGAFTGSTQLDMVVRWSDGEVTLYQGSSGTTDPQRPFVGETQLAKPGSIWTHAKGLATVNRGVVVTWSDGEVSYYPTVTKQGGFEGEVQLAAPNDLWRDHAYYIAGLGGDLVVVWSDGETTLYRGIAANGLKSEKQLIAPNKVWTNVRSLSGGNWVGSAGTADLLVRWIDGEFTIYGDVASAGLGQEHQVEAPNELWTHAIVTAGRGDGILVRWVDGEVSLYPSVDGHLHREIQLVAP